MPLIAPAVMAVSSADIGGQTKTGGQNENAARTGSRAARISDPETPNRTCPALPTGWHSAGRPVNRFQTRCAGCRRRWVGLRHASLPAPPRPTRHAPLVTNRLGLALDVREEGGMVIPLQPFLDERPEDDLKADRELERDRRLPGQDASPVQDVSGENKEDSGLTVEHHHLRILLRTPRLGRSVQFALVI